MVQNTNDVIVDGTEELQQLPNMATAGGRQMALLYGRRRVGKPFLLTHACRDREGVGLLYFTASATSPPRSAARRMRGSNG